MYFFDVVWGVFSLLIYVFLVVGVRLLCCFVSLKYECKVVGGLGKLLGWLFLFG